MNRFRYVFFLIYYIRYVDGETNAAYNCLDVHVEGGHGDQTAIIHDSPLTNVIEKISYKKLLEEVGLIFEMNAIKLKS